MVGMERMIRFGVCVYVCVIQLGCLGTESQRSHIRLDWNL